MKTKRIGVLVSGGGSNLQALLDAQAQGALGPGEIALVISSHPGVYALTRAQNAGVPTRVINRKEIPDRRAYSQAVLEALQACAIDIVAYAGFLVILDGCVADAFPNRMVNVHPALIPSFCGAGAYGLKVHQSALDYGVTVTGATVHLVTAQVDGGPILLQKAVEVQPDDTAQSLQKRVMEQAEWILLPKAVRLLCEDRVHVDGRKVTIQPRTIQKNREEGEGI